MKRSITKLIGTHSGTFHCDEALGVALLRKTNLFKDANLLRSRDETKLKTCDIVIDVGGVYDASNNRFDHHQKGFTEVFGHGYSTKLSSAGLVYKHFGREIVENELKKATQSNENLELVYLKMYHDFIEAIDGIDNGIERYESDQPPRYALQTDLGHRVSFLNPSWLETVDDEEIDRRFEKAVSLTGNEFQQALQRIIVQWLPARSLVQKAIDERFSIHESGQIIKLEKYCPWKSHLFEIEKQLPADAPKILYVLHEDEKSGQWRTQVVPLNPDSFSLRKQLPKEWCALRDKALDKASGIDGCVFVHANGFTGGAKTYDAALQMLIKAVEN